MSATNRILNPQNVTVKKRKSGQLGEILPVPSQTFRWPKVLLLAQLVFFQWTLTRRAHGHLESESLLEAFRR